MKKQWLTMTLCILSVGCSSSMYPIVSGGHAPEDANGGRPQRYAIWSNHPGVEHFLAGLLISANNVVVERAQIERIFQEQKFRLIQTSENEADLLHVGRLAGVTRLLFVNVQKTPIGYWTGAPVKVGVQLRGVDVETGRITWSGTGYYPDPPESEDQSVNSLAHWTMLRALCATEQGWIWTDPSRSGGGCNKPGHITEKIRY